MSRKTIALGILLTGLAAGAVAQSPEQGGPPPVLGIGREEIKPGRMAAHEKLNVAFVVRALQDGLPELLARARPRLRRRQQHAVPPAFGSFADVEAARKADEELGGQPRC